MSMLLLTMGATHTGKTTFSKSLQQTLSPKAKFVRVDNDEVDEFVDSRFTQLRRDKEVLARRTPDDPDLRLLIPRLVADYALQEGYSVIATASHPWRVIRRGYYDIANKHKAKIVLLNFSITKKEALKRMAANQRNDSILDTSPHGGTTFEDLYDKQNTFLQKPIDSEIQQCYRVFNITPNNYTDTLKEVAAMVEVEYTVESS